MAARSTNSSSTRRNGSRRPSATQRNHAPTPKAAAIVRLVGALVDGLGARGRTRLGRRITSMMVDTYDKRGRPLPRWVRDLIAYYGPGPRGS
jgi:predicted alpha/beta-hydrolase family hydrolase